MTTPFFCRRRFLKLSGALLAASVPRSVSGSQQKQSATNNSGKTTDARPTVGIALGAGGANGLAHILMLEALDELGITPHRIAGSSIGAIIGALYAAGMSGRQIHDHLDQFIISGDERPLEELVNKETLRWIDFIEVELGNGGLLSSEGFISYLYDTLKQKNFEQLRIPLKVVAADLWQREQIVLQSGELLAAIKASMALPGVFQPVTHGERVLVDGGTVNPVPYDLLLAECDIVIAIDVSGRQTIPESSQPAYFETIFNTIKVMQQAIMNEKLRQHRPDIYLSPDIVDIRALEFYRAEEILAQALPAKQQLKRQLSKLLPD